MTNVYGYWLLIVWDLFLTIMVYLLINNQNELESKLAEIEIKNENKNKLFILIIKIRVWMNCYK